VIVRLESIARSLSSWHRAPAGVAAAALAALATLAPFPLRAASPERHPGKFVWFDLLTDEPAACERFYGGLLGWQFEAQPDHVPPYTLIRRGGDVIGGIVEVSKKKEGPAGARWLSFVSVADVDRTAAAFRAQGGTVVREPFAFPGLGKVAVVTDPQGALLGLLGQERGDPAESRKPLPGRFLWLEYVARNAEAALSFYKATLGYAVETVNGGAVNYYTLSSEGVPRAGLYQSPWKHVRSNWLPYVLVRDVKAAAQKAAALGGKVLVEPRPNVRGGSLAIVTDPSGAAIALQKWPPEAPAKAK
jgi:predicted enzyme related to lactoylglutathione lyase